MPELNGVERFQDLVLELQEFKHVNETTNGSILSDPDCMEVVGQMEELVLADQDIVDFYTQALKSYRKNKPESVNGAREVIADRIDLAWDQSDLLPGFMSEARYEKLHEKLATGELVQQEARAFFTMFKDVLSPEQVPTSLINREANQKARRKRARAQRSKEADSGAIDEGGEIPTEDGVSEPTVEISVQPDISTAHAPNSPQLDDNLSRDSHDPETEREGGFEYSPNKLVGKESGVANSRFDKLDAVSESRLAEVVEKSPHSFTFETEGYRWFNIASLVEKKKNRALTSVLIGAGDQGNRYVEWSEYRAETEIARSLSRRPFVLAREVRRVGRSIESRTSVLDTLPGDQVGVPGLNQLLVSLEDAKWADSPEGSVVSGAVSRFVDAAYGKLKKKDDTSDDNLDEGEVAFEDDKADEELLAVLEGKELNEYGVQDGNTYEEDEEYQETVA